MGNKCGKCCCLKKQVALKEEPDVLPPSDVKYKSLIDFHVNKFEYEYYFLSCLELDLYLEYLTSIKQEYRASIMDMNSRLNYVYELDEPRWGIFVENRIIRNPLVTMELKNNDDSAKADYMSFVKSLYPNLIKCYLGFKKVNGEPWEDISSLSKTNLFTVGVAFCKAQNRKKILAIFDIFSQNGKLQNGPKLREFFYLLFSLVSKVYFNSLREFYKPEEIFSEQEVQNVSQVYNTSNILAFTDNFLKGLFEAKPEPVQSDFFKEMTNNLWVFYGSGVRQKLEEFKLKDADKKTE